MTIVDYFNPDDIAHIRAYKFLQDRGQWPEGFIPEDVVFTPTWHTELAFKIANVWIESMLTIYDMASETGC